MLSTINKNLTVAQRQENKSPVIVKPGIPFNYVTSVNTIAIWDGDQNLDLNNRWIDILGNSYVIDFTGSTTLPLTGGTLNGHNTVIFNGIDQAGYENTIVRNQPSTMYIVCKELAWNLDNIITDDTSFTFANTLKQNNVTPRLGIVAGGGTLELNVLDTPALNTFFIITLVFNGLNSQIRTNLNNATIGNAGNSNGLGITIGADNSLVNNCNCEIAYIILRNQTDNIGIQNSIISQLKNRFAI